VLGVFIILPVASVIILAASLATRNATDEELFVTVLLVVVKSLEKEAELLVTVLLVVVKSLEKEDELLDKDDEKEEDNSVAEPLIVVASIPTKSPSVIFIVPATV